MATHAKLSASKAERWINCPGSMQLQGDVPDDDDPGSKSPYAMEGTVAHQLAAEVLASSKHAKHWIGKTIMGTVVTEEMAKYIAEYVEHIRQIWRRCPTAQVEQKVTYHGDPTPSELSGTPDFCGVTNNGELTIVDLKYGAGKFVDVEDWQFKAYAVYYFTELPWLIQKKVKRIVCWVYQPRIENDEGPWRKVTYPVTDLPGFAETLVQSAWKTVQPDAKLQIGSHCQFCPVMARCPAQLSAAKEIAMELFENRPGRDATQLSDEEIARIIALAPTIKKWLGSIETHALTHVAAGGTIPGLKLVEKKTHRRWSNPDEVVKAMEKLNIGEAELFDRKLKTPAAVERLLGKLKSAVGPLTYKPRSVTLAPTSDPRPEVETAADLFADDENTGE